MHTQGSVTQDTGPSDGQIFVPPAAFDLAQTISGPGLLYYLAPASTTSNLYAALSQLLRTGVYPAKPFALQQFGTALSVPGPTAVANTSGPLGQQGIPPIKNLSNPTIAGPIKGPIAKGLQINWIDVIYQVLGIALTSVTFSLSQTIFKNAVAPAVTTPVALAANGLTIIVAAQPTRTRITLATPAYSILDGSELIANLNLVAPSGSTVKFYGMILGVTFNYN